MALRTLTILTTLQIFTAKILVFDSVSDLRKHKGSIIEEFSPVGCENKEGPIWSIICKSQHGTVPGKMDVYGKANYPWGGKEWPCPKIIEAVRGPLITSSQINTNKCRAQGHQYDSGIYYAALITSQHGLIPGKANLDRGMAWYSWEGKEIPVTKNFQYICGS